MPGILASSRRSSPPVTPELVVLPGVGVDIAGATPGHGRGQPRSGFLTVSSRGFAGFTGLQIDHQGAGPGSRVFVGYRKGPRRLGCGWYGGIAATTTS